MTPSPVLSFLLRYGWAVQIGGTIFIVFLVGWFARHSKLRIKAGWTYGYYPPITKMLIALFAAFMTAAVAYNGRKLFAEDWWVPPIILLLTAGAFVSVYEAFVTTLRWNNEELQIYRPPFRAKIIPFAQVQTCLHHPTFGALTFTSQDGTRIHFFYSYRVGMQQLLSRIGGTNEHADA